MIWIQAFGAALAAAGIKLGVMVSVAIGRLMSLSFFYGEQLSDGTCRPLPARHRWFVSSCGFGSPELH